MSTPRERLEELWSRLLAREELTPDEQRELLAGLESEPELRETLIQDALVDGWLIGLGAGESSGVAFAERIARCLSAERDGGQFLKRVESRIENSGSPDGRRRSTRRHVSSLPERRRWPFLLLATLAAAALIGLGLFFASPTPIAETAPWVSRQKNRDEAVRPDAARKERLEAIEQEGLQATRAEQDALTRQQKEAAYQARRKKDALQAEREAIEREMKQATDQVKKTATAPKLASPVPPGDLAQPIPSPAETRVAEVHVDRVEGEAFLVEGERELTLQAATALLPNQGAETVGQKSSLVVHYADATRLEVGPETKIEFIHTATGKRIRLSKGRVRAEVAKQPKDQPLIIETPRGEMMVLGTTLRIVVDPDPTKGTRLEVEEGKVQLKDLAGKIVLVESGHYAVAAIGIELVAKRAPIDEIRLLATEGKIFGSDWRRVREDGTSSGTVLEAIFTPSSNAMEERYVKERRSYVEFTFEAPADRDYYVWVRARSVLHNGDSDSTIVELPRGHFNKRGSLTPWADNVQMFDGYKIYEGYGWLSGQCSPLTDIQPEIVPVTVRFSSAGKQTLRLYCSESPMRVDVIRLSFSQKTRPEDTAGNR